MAWYCTACSRTYSSCVTEILCLSVSTLLLLLSLCSWPPLWLLLWFWLCQGPCVSGFLLQCLLSCLFRLFAHFLIKLSLHNMCIHTCVILLFNCRSFLYIWILALLSYTWFAKIFSGSVGFHFVAFPLLWKTLSSDVLPLVYFCFWCILFPIKS